LRAIAVELDVALSSASNWVRDIPRGPAPGIQPDPSEGAAQADEQSPVLADAPVRLCSRCNQLLPVTEFNRHGDGHQWWCRDCFREYFRERGALHVQQVRESSVKRRARARDQVYRYLEQHPRRDCGEQDPVVLEFDHLSNKTENIATLVYWGAARDRLELEIAQCEVVCANCHRRRTAKRVGSWRLDPTVLNSRPLQPEQVRNMKLILTALRAASCADCGKRDLLVLEFDHVGPKRAPITVLARKGYRVGLLEKEIEQCVVRCANCHRRRTAERGGHFRHRRSAIM
jgi:hypothetical protein